MTNTFDFFLLLFGRLKEGVVPQEPDLRLSVGHLSSAGEWRLLAGGYERE